MPWIALANQEHNGTRARAGVFWQPSLPIGRDQPSQGERIDVGGQRERDDVSLETFEDRSGLCARAAMRLVNGEPITRLCLPGRNESGIDFAIQLTGRIIGDVEQGDLFGRSSPMGADYSK